MAAQPLLRPCAPFDRAHAFDERHGGATPVLARVMPFVRRHLGGIFRAMVLVPGLLALAGAVRRDTA